MAFRGLNDVGVAVETGRPYASKGGRYLCVEEVVGHGAP